MTTPAVQTWLDRKMSARDDVVSALVVVSAPDGLRRAAVWPAGAPADGLERAACAAFDAGRRVEEPVASEAVRQAGADRLLSKPLLVGGQAIGALALALREVPAEPLQARVAAGIADSYRRSAADRAVHPASSVASGTGRRADDPASWPAIGAGRGDASSHGMAGSTGARSRENVKHPSSPSRQAVEKQQPVAHQPPPRSAPLPDGAEARLLALVGASLAHEGLERAATAVAGELCRVLDADRVCIGLFEGRLLVVKAVSHGAQQRQRARELREVAAAMDEAVDQSASVRYPAMPEDRPLITLSHAELAQRQSAGALCTIPMAIDGRIVGALTAERRSARPFDDAVRSLAEAAAAVLAPVLTLKQDHERPVLARLFAEAGRTIRQAIAPGFLRLKMGLAVAFLMLLALPLLPVEYRVVSPARLEGAVQRVLVAPADGFLKLANVRPGDAVKSGQVLAEMADDDLNLERRRWENEVSRYETSYSEAMARQDRAQVVIASARAAEARAQLDLVGQQISRSRLIAPFDGVVLKGDLKQQLGAPVRRGDVLLTLAPAEQFRVIIDVEDREVSRVRLGQTGEITLSARSHETYPVRVSRITPVSVARDGRNFFEVEAALEQAPPDLRPGLEGVAKLDAQEKSLYWVIGHRAWEWLRLALWSWSR